MSTESNLINKITAWCPSPSLGQWQELQSSIGCKFNDHFKWSNSRWHERNYL